MTSPVEFDLASTPLLPAVTVLEASAGTGKTFAIVGLWLRLLLESNLPHDRILVVTFTDAASAELRDRIYQRLVDASDAISQGHTKDPFLSSLLNRCRANDPELNGALRQLNMARADFDEAPIGTIHGFCHRAQRSRAFEAGESFHQELTPDTAALHVELVRDWWSSHLSDAPMLLVSWASTAGKSPKNLLGLVQELDRRPEVRRLSASCGGQLSDHSDQMALSLGKLRAEWKRNRAVLYPLLVDRKKWASAKKGTGSGTFRNQGLHLATCLDGSDEPKGYLELWNFSLSNIRSFAQHADNLDLHSPWMEERQRLEEAAHSWSDAWESAFLDWAAQEIPRRQRERRQFSYGDLLTRLRDALFRAGGDALCQAIRSDYNAVLVDEFQDTDPVQWQIFQRLFAVPDHQLWLVGDPKQAIYGFRGADIFTYLDAVRVADRRFTLGVNWRAGGQLVRHLNQFWEFPSRPFVLSGIEFRAIRAAPEKELDTLTDADGTTAPFQVWTLPESEQSNAEKTMRHLAKGVATEVVRLLGSGARLKSRLLNPGDIAVLGESRRQLEAVAAELRLCGVPAVAPTRERILQTAEAAEFERFLAGIIAFDREPMTRGALASDLVGLDGAALRQLMKSEPVWLEWLDRVKKWRDIWFSYGPLALFRQVSTDCRATARWLSRVNGERLLTNYTHVAELLQLAAIRQTLGPRGQIQWLTARRKSDENLEEDDTVRMERDDDAVQLLTLHGSKGLEFPVVFCPFWQRSVLPKLRHDPIKQVVVHPTPGSSESVWDLGSSQFKDHRALARVEQLAENMRLLYVGLTRASRRLYLGWQMPAESGSSLGWWLQGDTFSSAHAWLSEASNSKKTENGRLHQWAAQAGVPVREVPEARQDRWVSISVTNDSPEPRLFSAKISRQWRVASFSWLSAEGHDAPADRDPILQTVDAGEEGRSLSLDPFSVLAFPRGREAGTCLHRVLELGCVGAWKTGSAMAQIQEVLADFAIPVDFAPSLTKLLTDVEASPLTVNPQPLTLSDSPFEERVAELEFNLPLAPFSLTDLVAVLRRHAKELPVGFLEALAFLEFPPVEGGLRGFIDLVFRAQGRFWVVDWKSNYLGKTKSDYCQQVLDKEMNARLYPLQALIYSLAVDRWLHLRLPGYDYETHFGGVRYFFLRGIDPHQPGQGIFSLRPSAELIRDFASTLLVFPKSDALPR